MIDSGGVEIAPHAVIILSKNEDIRAGKDIFGVVCSSTAALTQPRPPEYIALPYCPSGPCCTKFTRDTVAVCTWTTPIPTCDFPPEDRGGYVRATKVEEIIAKIKEISAAKKAAKLVTQKTVAPPPHGSSATQVTSPAQPPSTQS